MQTIKKIAYFQNKKMIFYEKYLLFLEKYHKILLTKIYIG